MTASTRSTVPPCILMKGHARFCCEAKEGKERARKEEWGGTWVRRDRRKGVGKKGKEKPDLRKKEERGEEEPEGRETPR